MQARQYPHYCSLSTCPHVSSLHRLLISTKCRQASARTIVLFLPARMCRRFIDSSLTRCRQDSTRTIVPFLPTYMYSHFTDSISTKCKQDSTPDYCFLFTHLHVLSLHGRDFDQTQARQCPTVVLFLPIRMYRRFTDLISTKCKQDKTRTIVPFYPPTCIVASQTRFQPNTYIR